MVLLQLLLTQFVSRPFSEFPESPTYLELPGTTSSIPPLREFTLSNPCYGQNHHSQLFGPGLEKSSNMDQILSSGILESIY